MHAGHRRSKFFGPNFPVEFLLRLSIRAFDGLRGPRTVDFLVVLTRTALAALISKFVAASTESNRSNSSQSKFRQSLPANKRIPANQASDKNFGQSISIAQRHSSSIPPTKVILAKLQHKPTVLTISNEPNRDSQQEHETQLFPSISKFGAVRNI